MSKTVVFMNLVGPCYTFVAVRVEAAVDKCVTLITLVEKSEGLHTHCVTQYRLQMKR